MPVEPTENCRDYKSQSKKTNAKVDIGKYFGLSDAYYLVLTMTS